MFRTARITFQEAGHEPVTDLFRVWFIQELWTTKSRFWKH